MTDKQALAWARKRWGNKALIRANDHHQENSRRMVGVLMLGMFFEVRGSGPTWQAACDEAAARAERGRERLAARKTAQSGAAALPFILSGFALACVATFGLAEAGHLLGEVVAVMRQFGAACAEIAR